MWAGIECWDNAVREISFRSNGIGGQIAPEVGNLTNLSVFTVSDNRLSGRIPLELDSLINVQPLDLTGTDLYAG